MRFSIKSQNSHNACLQSEYDLRRLDAFVLCRERTLTPLSALLIHLICLFVEPNVCVASDLLIRYTLFLIKPGEYYAVLFMVGRRSACPSGH